MLKACNFGMQVKFTAATEPAISDDSVTLPSKKSSIPFFFVLTCHEINKAVFIILLKLWRCDQQLSTVTLESVYFTTNILNDD